MTKGQPRTSDFHTSVNRLRYCAACRNQRGVQAGRFVVHINRDGAICTGSRRTPADVAREPVKV